MSMLFETAKPFELAKKNYGGLQVTYRVGSSDESVLAEVLGKHVYRRLNLGFDVERGEHWLDLGANIGAFAVYCQLRGAAVDCYEPDSSNWELLKANAPQALIYRAAVTNQRSEKLRFRKGRSIADFSRATIIEGDLPDHPEGELPNLYGGFLKGISYFEGCKMDIEGSEFGLIDDELLPNCRKLVMEYHLLRDRGNLGNFSRRMEILRHHFKHVHFAPSIFQGAVDGKYQGRFDVPVFAWNEKEKGNEKG